MRRPIVGVMGSGSEEQVSIAAPLGERLALEGYHLLTGGGRGVMNAVTRSFVNVPQGEGPGKRKGLAFGIIPGEVVLGPTGNMEYKPKHGYPNQWVEVTIRTHLPLSGSDGKKPMSRNHMNVLSADYVVILPGGEGTKTEAELCVEYRKPCKPLTDATHLDDLIVTINRYLQQGVR